MIHNLQFVIDILFPPTLDHRHLRNHTPATFLTHYSLAKIDDTVALSSYINRTIKGAIKECKYHNNRHAATLLASLLNTWLATQPTVPTLLIPVPLSSTRLRSRGYNQVAQVCHALPAHSHITVAPTFLRRQRDTTPQTSLTRKARLSNMQDAFVLPQKSLSKLTAFQHIIICDDVHTTGATLAAARAAFAPHLPPGATLTTVAWAH